MNFDWQASSSVAASDEAFSRASYVSPVSRPQHGGDNMHSSKGNTGRRLVGDRRNTSSRHISTRDFTDWLVEQARRYSEKELADLTGLGIKGAQNLRAGKSGGKGNTIATWCQNDHIFAAKYAEYVGFIPPGHAEFAGRMNQAIAASQRMHMGGDAE